MNDKQRKKLKMLDAWIAKNVMGYTPTYTREYMFCPTFLPDHAMKVLRECLKKMEPNGEHDDTIMITLQRREWRLCSNHIRRITASHLELAICLFAKKLFSK